ncbi:MAG: metal ABC transporter ATP-binding protein [Chloroflexota bacterium]|nr:MAG: metal ABC transporter ATP-binding protein [Chloroflexota bacterium]
MSTLVTKIRGGGVDHEPAAPTLELEQVSVLYGAGSSHSVDSPGLSIEHYALHEISFQLGVGQQAAVVGPNGAGKSTLFKVVAGTVKPSNGMVHIYGHDPDQHICIGYVPQRSQIDWSFPATVEDVVMMGRVGQIGLFRWPSRRDWRSVRECLEKVNASQLAKKQIGELSGGQQQRVFIAQALAQGADLLLLDEPFSGLDTPSHSAILDVMNSLQQDRVTVMVATHDLNLARERFELVMLLNTRIIAFGPADRVLEPDNLLQAYGANMHVVDDEAEQYIVADGFCEPEDEHVH